MKSLFVIVIAIALLLNGCASLMDAKFTTREGRPSPFTPQEDNKIGPPPDPAMRP
jgi:uncharacterized protein YceK